MGLKDKLAAGIEEIRSDARGMAGIIVQRGLELIMERDNLHALALAWLPQDYELAEAEKREVAFTDALKPLADIYDGMEPVTMVEQVVSDLCNALEIWTVADKISTQRNLANTRHRETALREAIKQAMGCLDGKPGASIADAVDNASKTLEEALTLTPGEQQGVPTLMDVAAEAKADTGCEYRNYGAPTCLHDLLICSQPSCDYKKPSECPKLEGEQPSVGQRIAERLGDAGDKLIKGERLEMTAWFRCRVCGKQYNKRMKFLAGDPQVFDHTEACDTCKGEQRVVDTLEAGGSLDELTEAMDAEENR